MRGSADCARAGTATNGTARTAAAATPRKRFIGTSLARPLIVCRTETVNCGSFDFVRDQDDQIVAAGLLQTVRAARTRQNRGARTDVERFVVDCHDAAAAQHVVDLILFL